jgi:hypothetical protein
LSARRPSVPELTSLTRKHVAVARPAPPFTAHVELAERYARR